MCRVETTGLIILAFVYRAESELCKISQVLGIVIHPTACAAQSPARNNDSHVLLNSKN